MIQFRLALAAMLALGPAAALGYAPGTPYAWDPLVPNWNEEASVYEGTMVLDSLVLGDFMGVSPAQLAAWSFGDSGASVQWDDAWVGGVGCPNANGDDLDGRWAQVYSDGGWWDLGVPTDRVAVFTSQDHGPYAAEGLEYRVYGANELWAADEDLSEQAPLIELYLDGWRPHDPAEDANGNGWSSDDLSAVFQLPASYRYVKLVAWSTEGGLDEPEVDAVAATRIAVPVDVKPGSCPNPFNVKSRGVVPVAILGTAELDVSEIDPASVRLEGLAPLRWSFEDVGTPFEPYLGKQGCRTGCAPAGPDGYADLGLKFDAEALADALGATADRECRVVKLTGSLLDGTEIAGEDVVWILAPGKKQKK